MFYQNINWALLLNDLSLSKKELQYINTRHWFLFFSGGADSVLTLVFLILYHIQYPQKRELTIYYLNHSDQTTKDEEDRSRVIDFFKKEISSIKQLNIIWKIEKKEVIQISKRLKKSFEHTASRIRNKILRRYLKDNPHIVFFTGHNLTDWFETVITRLNRGSSPETMVPFPFFKNSSGYDKSTPLFLSDRNKIRQILNKKSIPYWNDPSNSNSTYYRNHIRNRISPDNIPGLIKTAKNFLHTFPPEDFSSVKNNLSIIEIKPYKELRIPLEKIEILNNDERIKIFTLCLSYLGMLPLSLKEKEKLFSLPYHFRPFVIEIENWNNDLFYTIRRGQKFLYPKEYNTVRASNITKKFFIQQKYGKKSVKKILSEKKISTRQRFNLFLRISEKDPFEVTNIPLSIFGMPDYHQYQSR